MGNLVKFGSYSLEAADRESKELGKSDFLKLEVGRNRIRVLPPKVGKDSPFVVIKQHRVEVPGEKFPHRFGCPGKGCPACLRSAELARTGNPKDSEAAYQLSAQPRVFALVVNRKDEDRGPIVWEFGKKIHEQLKTLRKNEDAGGDFCDPYKGFDVIVVREGTGKNDTKYQVMASRNSTPLHEDDDQMVAWMDAAPDLDRVVKISTPDELRTAMAGDGLEEEEPPARPTKKTRTAADDLEDEA